MNQHLKDILNIWTEYVEHPSTRDKKQWIVKSETDTNDADYIYGIDVVSTRDVINTLILLSWEASISDSKSYDGHKEYLIGRYHHDSEYYIRGISEYIETLDFTEIPEEAITFLSEYFKTGYGDSEISSGKDYYDYDDKPGYELIKIWFDDEIGADPDEKVKTTGYLFLNQMIEEITQNINQTKRNMTSSEKALVSKVDYKGEPYEEKYLIRIAENIKSDKKYIKEYETAIAMLESFYSQFPKPVTE